ncbi:MAG: MotA/TolQ/ExbB proton channel family protein [Verrucomicrobiae bacterium]|nr:MotA/TolQ/ExbB proton channel family protein [Verrucomicrobiae bacterium]
MLYLAPLSFLYTLQNIGAFLNRGGPLLYVLGLCMIITLTIILERLFALQRKKIISDEIVDSVERLESDKDLERLVTLCQNDDTALGRILKISLQHLSWPKSENLEAVTTRARAEVNRMERGLVILEIAVGLGPLIGLLGTVFGLMLIFEGLGKTSGEQQTLYVAAGISHALLNTVAGLAVAIPAQIGYSYYSRKIESAAVEMENICADLLSRVYRNQG